MATEGQWRTVTRRKPNTIITNLDSQNRSPFIQPFKPFHTKPSYADKGPIVAKPMPEGRPQKTYCFVERDDEYFGEVAKLEGAVVMYNSNLEINLTLEQVAQYAVQTKLVTADEISIGVMTRSRYVIILPHGLVPDTFIRAIPQEIWKEGNLFYQWSPLEDATVAMPHFKVLMDLVGIPLDIFREKEVIQATSSMGTYLGMVAQEKKGDVATWTVVVATTDLSLIPHKIGYMVGGLEREVETIPKTRKHCPLYKADEIVHPEKRYKPVFDAITTPSKASPENLVCLGEDEMFQVSRAVLAELCRGRDLTILPEQIRAAVAEQPMEILTQSNILEVTKDQ